MNKILDKTSLRKMLAEAVETKTQENPDAITLYAPAPLPTKRPWKPKPVKTVGVDLPEDEVERLKAVKEALSSAQEDEPASSNDLLDLSIR